jgi:transposase
MDLEEHTLETAGETCEECGAKLTQEELAAVLESGGPALCKIHAAEVVPLAEEDASAEDEA